MVPGSWIIAARCRFRFVTVAECNV